MVEFIRFELSVAGGRILYRRVEVLRTYVVGCDVVYYLAESHRYTSRSCSKRSIYGGDPGRFVYGMLFGCCVPE